MDDFNICIAKLKINLLNFQHFLICCYDLNEKIEEGKTKNCENKIEKLNANLKTFFSPSWVQKTFRNQEMQSPKMCP